MTAQDIKVNRDLENDVLYVLKSCEQDTKAVTNLIINPNITMRLNRQKKQIVGFTIHSFSTTCAEWNDLKPYQLMEEFDRILQVLNDPAARELTKTASGAVPA